MRANRALDFEYKSFSTEQNPNFEWTKMPTIREMAGQELEAFAEAATKDLKSRKSASLKSKWEEFESWPEYRRNLPPLP